MDKIIKSSDVKGGCIIGRWYDKVRHQNDNPEFSEDNPKPYTYIGPIKTTTAVHGWHFVFGDKFYVATYANIHNYSSRVLIYESDKNANFDCMEEIDEYRMYCDIETVVDMFCEKNKHLNEIN